MIKHLLPKRRFSDAYGLDLSCIYIIFVLVHNAICFFFFFNLSIDLTDNVIIASFTDDSLFKQGTINETVK